MDNLSLAPWQRIRAALSILPLALAACGDSGEAAAVGAGGGTASGGGTGPGGDDTASGCPIAAPHILGLDGWQQVHCQDFEGLDDWETAYRSGVWSSETPKLIQKVDHKARSGEYCLRGSMRRDRIDPITGVRGDPLMNFEWAPAEIGDRDEVLIGFWFRHDKGLWAGINDDGEAFSGHFAGKSWYITDVDESTGAFYQSMDATSFSANGAWSDWYQQQPYPWGDYYGNGRVKIYGAADLPYQLDVDGLWHQVHVYFNRTTHTLAVFIDGHRWRGMNDDGPSDGLIPVHPDFRLRGMQIFYTREAFLQDSVDTDPDEYAGAYQLDDFVAYVR